MKKTIILVSMAVVLAFVLSVNLNSLNSAKCFTNLENVTKIASAEAENDYGVGVHRCDTQYGGYGIPFWDRTCDDCHIRFNNWYGTTRSCYR
jgi:hypothetical protein